MSVYVNQDLLKIKLNTGKDLTGATEPKIYYQKPYNGTKGEWTGSIVETTKIEYDLEAGDLDIAGLWSFQATYKMNNEASFGKVVTQDIEKNLKP